MVCTYTGTARLGQYENLATVTGDYCNTSCETATDMDPSHYFGMGLDFGDLPEGFVGLTTLPDGARHSQIEPDLSIGDDKDIEGDGIPEDSASRRIGISEDAYAGVGHQE